MTNREEFERALAGIDHIDGIHIELGAGQFVWRLLADGQERFAARATPDQVAGMLQATEMLMNAEFGTSRRELVRPAFN